MSTYASEIVTLLNTSTPLKALLTGGIYDYSSVGRKGLWRVLQPGAFDEQTGLVKPICAVFEADEQMDRQAVSPNTGFFSTQTPVTLILYNNGNLGFDTIDQAYALMYGLLNNARLTGGFQIIWRHAVKNRHDPDLKDAAYYRIEVTVYGYRR